MTCREESEGRKAKLESSLVAERNASASTKYTTSRSERLVEELKARRFRQIFTYLDQAGLRPQTPFSMVEIANRPAASVALNHAVCVTGLS